MVKRKRWSYTEEKTLINNYETKTINELKGLLPKRDSESINCKIKRLKSDGKIMSNKSEDTKQRAYYQRGK